MTFIWRSYATAFKLLAVKKVIETGNDTVVREFKIEKRCIWWWKSEKLEQMLNNKISH